MDVKLGRGTLREESENKGGEEREARDQWRKSREK
jgi:hypothetical protein